MRIDAHQHFWTLARGDYGWLTDKLAPIYRDFSPSDLQPILARHRIEKTILVQAAPTVAETEFLLGIGAATPFVAGVVGWADFESAETPQVVARLAGNPLLVGLRPMIHDIADDRWMLRDDLAPTFEAMIAHGLVFDALVRPQHLRPLAKLLARYPKLAVVVDHGAKPLIRERRLEPWREDIVAIAAHPLAACKLSGLVTEAGANWAALDLRPYVDHLIEVFGPSRLLWGSDWPVVDLGGGYVRWIEATATLLAPLKARDRDAILGGNAQRVYLGKRGRR
jgi:L-fuconolactonase